MFRLITRASRTPTSFSVLARVAPVAPVVVAARLPACICPRSFATVSRSSGRSATQQLVSLIQQEVSDVSSHEDDTVHEYIKAFKFNVQVSADGSTITAHRRTEQGAEITVEFPTQAEEESEDAEDTDESLDADESARDENAEQDVEAGEEEAEMEPQKPHYFHVDIKTKGNGYLRLFCLATHDQHIDIYQLAFDPESAARATSTALSGNDADSAASERELLNWNDLPDEIASKLADHLHDTLKIDDDLASFVQAYSQQVRAKQYVEKMSKLQKFISSN